MHLFGIEIVVSYVEETEAWIGKRFPCVLSLWMRQRKSGALRQGGCREVEQEERNHNISMLVPEA